MRFWRNWQGHVTDNLSAFADGVLPARQTERIAEHLKACESCRQELEEIRFGAALAKHLTLVPAPEGLWSSIEQRWAERAADGAAAAGWPGWPNWPNWPGWQGWLTDRRFRWVSALASTALICAAALTYVALQHRLTPAPAASQAESQAGSQAASQAASGRFELGPYLNSVAAAPAESTFRAISSAAPSFASVDKQAALQVAGFGAADANLEPLPGYSLIAGRLAKVDGNPVAQLVFGDGEDGFCVFVASHRLKFLFGDNSCVDTKVHGIRCQKVKCVLQATYVFSQGALQCVLVSRSLGPERAADVMRYFMSAQKRDRRGE